MKQKKINFNTIDISSFKKKKISYDKIKYFDDNKIFGISYDLIDTQGNEEKNEEEIGTEIYNIKNESVETSMYGSPKNIFYSKDNKILVFLYDLSLTIINPTNFDVITKISANQEIKKETKRNNIWRGSYNNEEIEDTSRKFLHVEFLAKNYIGVIFKGNIKYIGENYGAFFDTEDLKVINSGVCFEKNRYGDYIHLILYEMKNNELILKKVIPLIKKEIMESEISYVTGKYCDDLGEYGTYCQFYFDGLTKISEEELIISFKCRIKLGRAQYYYFITERAYKNETLYYLLNFKNDDSIKEKIGSSKEKSFLFKNNEENDFYLFYDKTESFAKILKDLFDNKNLNLINVQLNKKLEVRNVEIRKNIVIGWNTKCIYLGIIFNNNLEIIQNVDIKKGQYIKYISLVSNYILYNNRKDKDENELKKEDKCVEEELFPEKKDKYSFGRQEESDDDN